MLHVSLVASFLCSSTCGSSMAASRSPNYLAIIVRQVCKESPKEAIDRQVVSEMKYLVKNIRLRFLPLVFPKGWENDYSKYTWMKYRPARMNRRATKRLSRCWNTCILE